MLRKQWAIAAERGSGQKRPYGHAGRARSRSISGVCLSTRQSGVLRRFKGRIAERRSAISYVSTPKSFRIKIASRSEGVARFERIPVIRL